MTMTSPITLYRLPESAFFSQNAIVRAGKDNGDLTLLTLVHGTCVYDNGVDRLPGAYDKNAYRSKVPLPKPYNPDRSDENRYGWSLGDLAEVIDAKGILHGFQPGTLVQLVNDDDSTAPKWERIAGPAPAIACSDNCQWVDYAQVNRVPFIPLQETAPMPRSPFEIGDRVVPNGFRARGHTHRYGTSAEMERWEAEAAVLTVENLPHQRVVVEVDRIGATYHPAELRVALDDEILKADAPKAPPLAAGSVIRADDDGRVMIVTRPEPDSDDDIRVLRLDASNPRSDFYPVTHPYTLLGRVMPDGDFRPA